MTEAPNAGSSASTAGTPSSSSIPEVTSRKRRREEFEEMCPVWSCEYLKALIDGLHPLVEAKAISTGRTANVRIKYDEWENLANTIDPTPARVCNQCHRHMPKLYGDQVRAKVAELKKKVNHDMESLMTSDAERREMWNYILVKTEKISSSGGTSSLSGGKRSDRFSGVLEAIDSLHAQGLLSKKEKPRLKSIFLNFTEDAAKRLYTMTEYYQDKDPKELATIFRHLLEKE